MNTLNLFYHTETVLWSVTLKHETHLNQSSKHVTLQYPMKRHTPPLSYTCMSII